MVFAGKIVHRKAEGERLAVSGLGGSGSVHFAGLRLGLGSRDEFDFRERQKIAEFGGVDEI